MVLDNDKIYKVLALSGLGYLLLSQPAFAAEELRKLAGGKIVKKTSLEAIRSASCPVWFWPLKTQSVAIWVLRLQHSVGYIDARAKLAQSADF